MEKNNEEKIYGIYPGCIGNPDAVETLNEAALYEAIDFMGGVIWRCEHDMADGRIEPIDLTEEKYAIEFLVDKTRKFGVELPEPKAGQHITPTESYRAWFKFFHDHFKYTLTDEEWKAYQKAQQNKEDISQYMPKESWKDLLKEESSTKTR